MAKIRQEINDYKGYKAVTVGSLIHILRAHQIDTDNIFIFKENHTLNPDVILNIKGKIYDNKEAFEELEKILISPENRGKRILLVADTGTGKSYALTKFIKKFNEKINASKYSSSLNDQFAVYSCPRRALINNLKEDFISDGHSAMLTGSDNYTAIERDIIINKSSSFITTIDHAPRIIEDKMQEESKKNRNELPSYLLVTDEIHVLSTDASFKLETIRDYFIAERAVLDNKGVSLFVTATPENLRTNDYDMIIQINQENHENPFKEAGYHMLDQSTKKLKSQFLRMIRFSAESNKDRKLLVFIEDKEWIKQYCDQLQKHNINAIGVVAKKESERGEEEIMIIDNGKVGEETQVILATTVLSSGVSIINNDVMDETWVLCSSNSMNHELTRLTQMSHRFRNKYNAFKIFFQKAEVPKVKKEFLYHTLLEERLKKAENSKELVMKIRLNPIDYFMTLDNVEQQLGLYSDKSGQLHVLTPMIQSELIRNKTYYNYKNQDELIRELEQRFQCELINFDKDLVNVIEEVEESELNTEHMGLSNLSSKEIIKMITENRNMYDNMRKEYIRFGRGVKNGLIGKIKRHAKNDLIYFIEQRVDYEVVQQVIAIIRTQMTSHAHILNTKRPLK
ncbi:DEAD/DEAH box helicase family protein [Bacillus sp. CRN 9]|nr:DEAD/DEAH box helicase family protein [Bacillus sp. CRN 9]